MLSRRRSSEQPSDFPGPPASPSLARLENALRGVHVLFSTIAEPDCLAAPTSRSPTSNPTDGRSTPPPPPMVDPPLRRRLFSRDARPDRQRRITVTPPVQRLVVAVSVKNSTHIRLYHLHDYVTAPRVSVSRAWNLADLRKIDGLGQSVSESVRFGLFFASGKMLVWRTQSPSARAAFLWSLLQTCATRLKRAPPVQHLRLLDLQTFADNPCPSFHSHLPEAGADDSSSTNYAPSDKSNLRLTSILDDLPHDQASQSPRENTRSVTFLHTGSPSHSDTKPPTALAPAQFRAFPASPTPLKPQQSPRGGHRVANPPASRRMQDDSQNQRVTRTLSEPKVNASIPKQSESSQALTLQPRMRDKISRLQIQKDSIDNRNIDERAFQAAAKRMGAKQSEPICRAVILEQFANVGTNAQVRIPRGRLDVSDQRSPNGFGFRQKLDPKVSELNADERTDLVYALDLYTAEMPTAALPDFGTWAESQIQTLEVDNIADIISSENRTSSDGKQTSLTGGQRNPFDLLVDSVHHHSMWLEKSETLLAPYANLADDINKEVTLLELQRKNVVDLDNRLGDLIGAITCTSPNLDLFNDLDMMELPTNPLEVNFTELFQAIDVISSKSQALETLSGLSDVTAVSRVRDLVTQKQQKVSRALLPCLQKVLSMNYDVLDDKETVLLNASLMRLNTADNLSVPVLCELCKGARYLRVCDDMAFWRLIDHYVVISLNRVQKLVQYLTEGPRIDIDKKSLDAHATCVLEGLLYACLSECFHVIRLFGDSFKSFAQGGGNETIMSIMQRQVPSASFFEHHLQKIAGEDVALKSCLLLHFSYSTKNFCQWLEECTDTELQAILHRVDGKFSFPADFERPDAVAGPAWASVDLNGRLRHQDQRITRNNRLMNQFLESFSVSCIALSAKCVNMVEDHVNAVIALMGAPREVGESPGRAAFFTRVKDSVDLCKGLASPTFQAVSDSSKVESKTRLLCEKLLAGAMRNIEVSSASSPKGCGDIVKLQCYGYIAGCLAVPEQGFLVELGDLSSRVRKHVMRKWAEDCVCEVIGGFGMDTLRPASGMNESQLREFIADLKSSDVGGIMKRHVRTVMERAAETCAVTALYGEVLACVRERMEEIFRCVKKDKSLTDVRPQLVALTRDLVNDFRDEMRRSPVLSA